MTDIKVMAPSGEVHFVRGYGPFAYWQADMLQEGWPLPTSRDARFKLFMTSHAPLLASGPTHFHLFYDRKSGQSYWRVVNRGSTVCRERGRCIRGTITVEDLDDV